MFFFCFHSFAFTEISYSWNHAGCSLFRLASFPFVAFKFLNVLQMSLNRELKSSWMCSTTVLATQKNLKKTLHCSGPLGLQRRAPPYQPLLRCRGTQLGLTRPMRAHSRQTDSPLDSWGKCLLHTLGKDHWVFSSSACKHLRIRKEAKTRFYFWHQTCCRILLALVICCAPHISWDQILQDSCPT